MDIKELKSIRAVRAALPDVTLGDLDEIIDVFNKLKDIIKKRQEKELADIQKRNEDRNKVLEFMKQNNISASVMSECLANASAPVKTGKKLDPKYRYVDVNGVEGTWTGRGKMPKPFAQLLASNGKDKSEYLINKD